MSRWANVLIGGVAALTASVLVIDTIVSLGSGMYLNLGSGVWLALARDLHDGVFYRPLWNGSEYGGTRYFPMLFGLTAGLMRLGVNAVAAGVTVSMAGLVMLAAAVTMLLKRLAVPSAFVLLGSALSIAPYFVHQTAFAIRCEPIAAAFAIFGLAVLSPVETRDHSTARLMLAAALFVGAFMTKVTCVYAPAAAIVALLASGQSRSALKLAIATTCGALLGLGFVNLASNGRAIESFRACALAGSSLVSLLSSTAVTRALQLIATSHLLTTVFLLVGIALIATPKSWLQLPALYLLAAAAITAVIFTSPGTILTSQIVDAYVAAIIVLVVFVAGRHGRALELGCLVLTALAVWTAGQNVARISTMIEQGSVRSGAQERGQLIAAVNGCGGPIVSESPLIPILAGQRPLLLDPFAFHVVSLNRPEVGHDLVERIRRREFPCVVFEQDPSTPKGQAWYSNVNLTRPVMEAVLEQYKLEQTIAGERFYRAVH
jgi:hypothetical protein